MGSPAFEASWGSSSSSLYFVDKSPEPREGRELLRPQGPDWNSRDLSYSKVYAFYPHWAALSQQSVSGQVLPATLGTAPP